MVLRRLLKIIQSNLNNSRSSGKEEEFDHKSSDDTHNSSGGQNETEGSIDPIYLKESAYYANLESRYGEDFVAIKKAYKTMMKKYHPDKFQNNDGLRKSAEEITSKLNEAYSYFEKKFSKK